MDDQLNELQIENLKSISKNQLSNDEKSTLLSNLEKIKTAISKTNIQNENQDSSYFKQKEKSNSIFINIINYLTQINELAEKIDLPITEYEKSDETFLKLQKEKLDLINYKNEGLNFLQELDERKNEGESLTQNLLKKIEFLKNTIENYKNMINEKISRTSLMELKNENITRRNEFSSKKLKKTKKYIKLKNEKILKLEKNLTEYKENYKKILQSMISLERTMNEKKELLKAKEIEFDINNKQKESILEDYNKKINELIYNTSKLNGIKQQIIQNESEKINELSTLQNDLLENQRKNLDLLILNKFLKPEKSKIQKDLIPLNENELIRNNNYNNYDQNLNYFSNLNHLESVEDLKKNTLRNEVLKKTYFEPKKEKINIIKKVNPEKNMYTQTNYTSPIVIDKNKKKVMK